MVALDRLAYSVLFCANQSGEPYSWCNKGDGRHQCLCLSESYFFGCCGFIDCM